MKKSRDMIVTQLDNATPDREVSSKRVVIPQHAVFSRGENEISCVLIRNNSEWVNFCRRYSPIFQEETEAGVEFVDMSNYVSFQGQAWFFFVLPPGHTKETFFHGIAAFYTGENNLVVNLRIDSLSTFLKNSGRDDIGPMHVGDGEHVGLLLPFHAGQAVEQNLVHICGDLCPDGVKIVCPDLRLSQKFHSRVAVLRR